MNTKRVLAAEASAALIVQTAQDLMGAGALKTTDGTNTPSLPRPKRIVGTLAFYSILSLGSEMGDAAARFAAASGGVALLTLLVVGPGGKAAGKLLDKLSTLTEAAA